MRKGAIPEYQGDLRQLDTESMLWSKLRASAEVCPCLRPSAATVVSCSGLCFAPVLNVTRHVLSRPWQVYPSGRYGHSLALMGNQLVLFGGWGLGGLQSAAENKRTGALSFFSFDVNSSTWWQPPMPAKPMEHKYGQTATVMGDSLFIFGGWSGKQASNTLVQLVFQQL